MRFQRELDMEKREQEGGTHRSGGAKGSYNIHSGAINLHPF